jgi:hypothetical protein
VISAAEAVDLAFLTRLIGLLQMLIYLATGVMFIIWFRRAYRNLEALGKEGLRFEAGWTVGEWLLPILNLVRPKQIMNDLWRATDAIKSGALGTASTTSPTTGRGCCCIAASGGRLTEPQDCEAAHHVSWRRACKLHGRNSRSRRDAVRTLPGLTSSSSTYLLPTS